MKSILPKFEQFMTECGNVRYMLEREPEGGISETALSIAERLLAIARQAAEIACSKCSGRGSRPYPSTSGWRGGTAGQILTSDVCDVCWGTGRNDRIGVNLRKVKGMAKEMEDRIQHLEDSLRHIAKHWPEDPEAGQFAQRAAENPPTAFPPKDDNTR